MIHPAMAMSVPETALAEQEGISVSRKNPDLKTQWPITEAAEKAELLIRGLQSRLAESADIAQAGVVRPDVVKPDVVKPDFVKPDVVQTDVVQTDVAQSDVAQPADILPDDPGENLDLALEGYFAAEESTQLAASRREQALRKRIVDGVADKILNSCDWSQDGRLTPQFESEVIERLVERVFERLLQTQRESPERSQRELQEPTRSPAR